MLMQFKYPTFMEIIGSQVIPEFPISLIALATSLTGFIIVRYVFRWFN